MWILVSGTGTMWSPHGFFCIQSNFYQIVPDCYISTAIWHGIHAFEIVLCIFLSTMDFVWISFAFFIGILAGLFRKGFFFPKIILAWLLLMPFPLSILQQYWINNWQYQKNLILINNPVFIFLAKDEDESDMASMDQYFNAESKYENNQISFFTKTSHSVYVGNCANTHILNYWTHFIEFTPLYANSGNNVSIVGGNAYPSGVGTVRWSWHDDDGAAHTF